MNNGNVNNNNKTNTNKVRAVAPATPQTVYDIPFESVIEAYRDCERNKRTSNSCTRFRWHAARDLVRLWQAMRNGEYTPGKSMVFMVNRPVLREVWAGSFIDRVAHHWEYLRFGPVIEKYFVEVGDRSMNCRKGYGSLRAVQTFERMLCEYTENYTRSDCFIVGGDFANFFMSIVKPLLWELMPPYIRANYTRDDIEVLLYMMHRTLFHRCQDNYYRRSPESMWDDLPKRKSLFYMDGLTIGNLPSQIWANFMGAVFTDWMIKVKRVDGFVIFVDDWRCLVRTEAEGRQLIRDVTEFLWSELRIKLHPDKIYLQHYTKGTKLVGAVIKAPDNRRGVTDNLKALYRRVRQGLAGQPGKGFVRYLLSGLSSDNTCRIRTARTYISNRTRGGFINAMVRFNAEAERTDNAGRVAMLERLRATVNSYLGQMRHHRSYKVRRDICQRYIEPLWGMYIYFTDEYRKCTIRAAYDPVRRLRHSLRHHRSAASLLRPRYVPPVDDVLPSEPATDCANLNLPY